jgi:hypothetical protein
VTARCCSARPGDSASPRAEAPLYPISATLADELNIFDADLRTPYVHSFSAGFQRSLGRDTAIEARYVGNRNQNVWTTEDWNELVIFENGFMDEFRLAQANLRANIAAGNGSTFAYTGARHIAARDLSRVFQREHSSGRSCGLLVRELPELGLDWPSRRVRAGSRRCRQRPARCGGVAGKRSAGRRSRQLLRDEPRH